MTTVSTIHPISAISSCILLYKNGNNGNDGKINLQIDFDDFEFLIKNVELKMQEFQILTDAAIKGADIKSDTKEETTLAQIQERGSREIIMSYLGQDFVKRHNVEMRKMTANEIVDFVKQIVGSQSEDQKSEKAKKQLEETDRRENENFEFYFNRLSAIAGVISKTKEVQDFLIRQQFKACLSPQIKQFLVDQGKNTETMPEIAKFLDDKQKFKKTVSLSSVHSDQVASISQQNKVLQEQLQLITELLQNKSMETDDEFRKMKKSINKIERTKKTENQDKTMETQREFCKKCGMFNHTTLECRGCRMTCNECKVIGHLRNVCPSISKNL
jgi:hypothetical protein